ncbi:hypothetical protein [Aquirhabdus sp.]|uniref:hypothetical protein n=1 Tax=Aquirhabdus sp. TaxID=2824160 RepID=UPI00396C48F8
MLKLNSNTRSKPQLPLAPQGLYTPTQILQLDGFPWKRTWLWQEAKVGGKFVPPIRIHGKTLFRGEEVNKWFEAFGLTKEGKVNFC